MFYPPHSAKVALLTLLFLGGSGAAHAQAAPLPLPQPRRAAAAAARRANRLCHDQLAPGPGQCPDRHHQPQHRPLEGAQRYPRHDSAGYQLHAARSQHHAAGAHGAGRRGATANGPAALSPAFAVFRNLDALYDVMLRVTETAGLAGSAVRCRAAWKMLAPGWRMAGPSSAPGCCSP